MCERLVIDDIVHWAIDYKVGDTGFRVWGFQGFLGRRDLFRVFRVLGFFMVIDDIVHWAQGGWGDRGFRVLGVGFLFRVFLFLGLGLGMVFDDIVQWAIDYKVGDRGCRVLGAVGFFGADLV